MKLSNAANWLRPRLWRCSSVYYALRRAKRQALTAAQRVGLIQGVRYPERPEIQQIQRIVAHPESQRLLKARTDGSRILFFSLRGAWTTHTAWETVIALGLRLRGARVGFFTCGGALPACGVGRLGRPPCGYCYPYLLDFVRLFGFPVRVALGMVPKHSTQRAFHDIEKTEGANLLRYRYKGLPIGRIVLPTVRWSLRRGTLPDDEETLGVCRAFLKSAVIVTEVCQRLFAKTDHDVIFCLNGEFFAEEILRAVAMDRGIRVVTYERGYRPDTLFFQHNGPACKYSVDNYWERVAAIPLTAEENRRLDEYLTERHRGIRGIGGVVFWPKIEQDEAAIRDALGLDVGRPLATLFTNTPFDTATQGTEVAFRDMFHWVEDTIDYFASHPEWQLVVRTHPSEVRDVGRESQEPMVEQIAAAFPQLPNNVRVVSPESPLSSYTLMRLSRAGLVYTSTVGLEMALMGKPALLAGKAHYRGKGFTDDASSLAEYFGMLEHRLAEGDTLTTAQVGLARRYANLFFFRAMIPFDLLSEPTRGEVALDFENLTDLMPGRNQGLDVICDGVLSGRDFVT